MVLMLDEAYNVFMSKEYKRLKECLPYLKQILDYDVSTIPVGELHAVLKKSPEIKSKVVSYKTKDEVNKKARLYYIGTLKAYAMRPEQYDREITEMGLNFEKITGITLPWLMPQVSLKTSGKHNEPHQDEIEAYADEITIPNESDMDYCNQQLLDKYQVESKKVVKLTESQFKRLHKLINRI